jgi:hypothetical protein
VKTTCFEPFRFPDASEPQRERIRFLGEQLDAHRKRQQEAHPNLTVTQMYNVLDELRSGQPLCDESRVIHDLGLVSVLRDLHDSLDRAVADAPWLARRSRGGRHPVPTGRAECGPRRRRAGRRRAVAAPRVPEVHRGAGRSRVEREEEIPAAALARSFTRARVPDVVAILETLAALGQARHDATGYRT